MNFKQFLIEQTKNNKLYSELSYQNILTNLDMGHIEYADDKITFSIGRLIKDSKLDNLFIVIRKAKGNRVRYGSYSAKEGAFAIVIDTKKYPKRADVDKFLSTDPKLHHKILAMIENFAETNVHDGTPKHPNEMKDTYNNKGKFEEAYDVLLKEIDKLKSQYASALKELDNEANKSLNYTKRLEFDLAKENLKTDYFGKSAKEFISKLSNTENGKFINHLEKDFKNMVVSRLTDYYESIVE